VTPSAIQTRALRKVYPAPTSPPSGGPRGPSPAVLPAVGTPAPSGEIVALDALDLEIAEGELFGLLGPNGAGKSTTIGILTTRVRPSGGRATVAGADVGSQPVAVRQRIGVVPQRPNPDRGLNAIENLLFHAAYFGVTGGAAARRASALLEQLGIADKAGAKVDELSGGQQQRLMIARALIHEPRVIFLDEPTVGLDPQARLALWEILRALHSAGRTIVLTTHYMDEAEKLCDRLAIVDRGRLLALDTTDALRARAPGGTLVEIALDGDAADAARRAAGVSGVQRAEVAPRAPNVLRVFSDRGGLVISPIIQAVQEGGRVATSVTLSPPSLETLFISLTGRKLD
jgi:ABC-2 type transport system ATP-binding protein